MEAAVAEEFGVSVIPVREAVRELSAMGIVEITPNRGARVREVKLEETIQALRVKAEMEGLAAETAAPVLKGRCQSLRKTVDAIIQAAKDHDYVAFQRHNQRFHVTVIEAAANPVVERVWHSLAFEVRTRFILDYLQCVDVSDIAREHEPMLEALDAGDAERAAELLRSHADGLIRYLREEAEVAVA